jgi:hypothetical protein
MPRGIPSYFHVNFLKFGYNNYDFVENLYLLKHPNSCRWGNTSDRWRHPQVQTDAWTKTVFFARCVTETDARGQYRRPTCVTLLEMLFFFFEKTCALLIKPHQYKEFPGYNPE